MRLAKRLDVLLDGMSMYRLTLYYLIGLLLAAAVLSALGQLGYNPAAIILSALYLAAVCWISNSVFACVFEAQASVESAYITALILALIITPLSSTHNVLFLTAAGGLAMASKYILAIRKRHVFNPAAIAVLLTALGAGQTASWWVGSAPLLPFVVIGGVLLARKIRRMRMVLLFFAVGLIATVSVNMLGGNDVAASVRNLLLHSSFFFLGFVMLTEPATTPPTAQGRTWYAVLVAALFPPQVRLLGVYSTPELALSVGNAFAYIVSPKARTLPKLAQRQDPAPDIADFVFIPAHPFSYRPGQYVEVTMPHVHADARGNRRYFTLASSPTEHTLRLGVKFHNHGSSFKQALLGLGDGAAVAFSPPAGDFVLPRDASRKLAFIAGGIGVTPYRSMVQYLLDSGERRPVTLLYAEKRPEEFVYLDVFEAARERLGLQLVCIAQEASADWSGQRGRITEATIKAAIPDYQECLFYVSGSSVLVASVRRQLRTLGVSARHIKTDYFPGYA